MTLNCCILQTENQQRPSVNIMLWLICRWLFYFLLFLSFIRSFWKKCVTFTNGRYEANRQPLICLPVRHTAYTVQCWCAMCKRIIITPKLDDDLIRLVDGVVAFNHISIAQVKVRVWMNFFLLFSLFWFDGFLAVEIVISPKSVFLHDLAQFSIVSGTKTSFPMRFKLKLDLSIHWIQLFETETNVYSST